MSVKRKAKDVGVREFRDYATKYMSGSDPLAIRKNGHLIGIYVPIKRDDEQARQDAELVEQTVSRVLERNGIAGTEGVDLSDIYWPPERDEAKRLEAIERFGRTMERIRNETGMTEDEFADMFDLTKPFPE